MTQKKKVFTGAGVALITPFRDGEVDYPALERILEQQIAGGTDAIIVCGTTAEAATLTDREHKEIIAFSVEKVNHRVPVIAGALPGKMTREIHGRALRARARGGPLPLTRQTGRGCERRRGLRR